ncbi:MAG: four helix bundle protein [Bacteroidetes bacterium]|nr:four helix bundle protein [Bacteroidota bacterium]MCK6609577.1 four helix bundle protein [Bacteroidia bacterium]
MGTRDFRKYAIWKDSIQLTKSIYLLVASFPKEERFGLSSQLIRAATSIPSNIAEGCSRSSESDFKRYLEIALGSAYEVETQLVISSEIGLLEKDRLNELIGDLQIIQKQILQLIHKIENSIKTK